MGGYERNLSTVEAYIRALNNLDAEAYVGLFTPDCVVLDPYSVQEYTGEEGLRQFINGMTKTWRFFEMRMDNMFGGGEDRIAVRWSVSATAQNKRSAEFSGISIFVFNGGKIARLEAYWNQKIMLSQIQD